MADKVFSSTIQIKNYIENGITKAINETMVIAKDELYNCVESQYYNDADFYPNVYERTESFLRSCAYELLSPKSAQVGIDTDRMHYSNGFSGEKVVEYASQSMHGSEVYQTGTTDFWTTFLEWADKNLVNILKTRLNANNIPVK